MKKSYKPTGYIVVEASTNGEFDTCDFAIIHLTEEWQRNMREHLQLLELVKHGAAFHGLCFWATTMSFYIFSEDVTKDILPEKATWGFIEMEPYELLDLEEVNNELCGHELQLSAFNTGFYQAYGEQGNATFYTEPFCIADILEQLAAQNI